MPVRRQVNVRDGSMLSKKSILWVEAALETI
jgi:hypothetical protein